MAFHLPRVPEMRAAVLFLLSACAAWPQFRSTVPLVVAPTTIKDSKGRIVDGLEPSDLILYDNNVLRPIQADIAVYPISLVVAVESSEDSKAVLDKLGSSGILFSQLLAADQGETALISFSDQVTELVPFASDPEDLTQELKRMRPDGGGAAALDGLTKALDLLAHRKPGRRLIVLMIAESRDRSSQSKLPEVVQRVQQLNAAVYWLSYSTTWKRYTDRCVTTYGDIEDPKEKGKDKEKKTKRQFPPSRSCDPSRRDSERSRSIRAWVVLLRCHIHFLGLEDGRVGRWHRPGWLPGRAHLQIPPSKPATMQWSSIRPPSGARPCPPRTLP